MLSPPGKGVPEWAVNPDLGGGALDPLTEDSLSAGSHSVRGPWKVPPGSWGPCSCPVLPTDLWVCVSTDCTCGRSTRLRRLRLAAPGFRAMTVWVLARAGGTLSLGTSH